MEIIGINLIQINLLYLTEFKGLNPKTIKYEYLSTFLIGS